MGYTYHVFYGFSRADVERGAGTADVTLSQRIQGEADMQRVSEELAKRLKADEVQIFSFSLFGEGDG